MVVRVATTGSVTGEAEPALHVDSHACMHGRGLNARLEQAPYETIQALQVAGSAGNIPSANKRVMA